MKRFLKWTLAAIAAVVAAIAASLFVQGDGFVFLAQRAEMKALIAQADQQDRELSSPLREYLLFLLNGHPSGYAARLLVVKFDPAASGHGEMKWQLVYLVWSLAASLSFSDQDCLTVIALLAPTGGDNRGFNNTARGLFGHPSSELSPEEAATLVVLVKAPGMFYNHPDRLAAERDGFMERYKQHQQ